MTHFLAVLAYAAALLLAGAGVCWIGRRLNDRYQGGSQ